MHDWNGKSCCWCVTFRRSDGTSIRRMFVMTTQMAQVVNLKFRYLFDTYGYIHKSGYEQKLYICLIINLWTYLNTNYIFPCTCIYHFGKACYNSRYLFGMFHRQEYHTLIAMDMLNISLMHNLSCWNTNPHSQILDSLMQQMIIYIAEVIKLRPTIF